MIKEISQAQKVASFATVTPRKNIRGKQELASPAPQTLQAPIVKYTSNHIKANYLNYKASSAVSFGIGENIPALQTWTDERKTVSISRNITNLPSYKLSNGHYYDELSNDLAILMGPGKNALLTHEEGVSSDLLVHNFTQNMLDKKYIHEGLHPYKTDVMIFDAAECLGKGKVPFVELTRLAVESPHRKKVVFIENFHQFFAGFSENGLNAEDLLKEGKFPNTQIVGLMPKKVHDFVMTGKSEINPVALKQLGRVDFDGLNAADTKDLLKKDARFITNILKRYDDIDLKISYNAIDAIVDNSAASINGAFPAKALKVLDLAAAAKATELKHHKPGAAVQVNSSDVKRFFENHTSIIDKLKPEQGQFKLAENIKTKLADVGGISTIKEEIKDDILDYLKDPKKFAASGRVVPNGKLLTGPPGNGKTLLARAIAGETGIPFIAASGSEFVEKYVGVGAQRMRELFENAKKAAAASEKKIAIVFIDEIDAFAKARGADGGGGGSESEKTLNQLLTEMDGFNKSSKIKVFVLAATNRKDIIDPALLRFGRFDGGIEVSAPATHTDRLEILNIHARNKNFATEADKAKILNGAAKMTEGMSGADLAGVLSKAAKVVSKRPDNQVMTYNDMVEGYLQVIAGPIKKNDSSIEELRNTVRHEGGHAVVIDSLKQDKVSFITLDSRGKFLGAVFRQPSDNMPNFKSVIYSAATSYAGGQGEPGFDAIGHGAGVSQDLQNATSIIDRAIKKWGLGVNTPQLSMGDTPSDVGNSMLGMYNTEIKKDIKLFSETAQKISKKIVDFHQGFLDNYVKKFEENAGKGGNNLSGEEFSKLREDWVVKTGKTKEFKALQKEIEKIVTKAQSSNLSIFKKVLKAIAR